ncbi:hypothetical protein KKF29_03495 [Patescibacteria group bacterium]|nr:hypothetical protein [Patescibacteria group bacterium]
MKTSQCTQCQKTFKIFPEDQDFYKRVNVPEPTECPACRMQRRLAFRNERTLYQDKCALCNNTMLSLYNSKDGYKVYCQKCYWSDNWDQLKTGRNFYFNRPFFEQFQELQKDSPRLAMNNINSENSEFTNAGADNKNCYLLFAAENNENCSFGKLVQECKDSYDCNFIYNSELCYNSIDLKNCYHVYYSKDLQDCTDCHFSIDLKGCRNCLFCSNLVNKENYINNKEVSEEKFIQEVDRIFSSYENTKEALEKFQQVKDGRFACFSKQIKSENCIGDYLEACRRVYDSYDVTRGQDCRYLNDALDPKDCHDSAFIYYNPELCYETMSTLQMNNVQFCLFCYYGSNLQYNELLHNCSDCFGCTGMRKKKFCIFNKQYEEQEYKKLKQKIINHMKKTGEWGKMFPINYSCFAYNDTVAQEYFPLKKEQAMNLGLKWNDEADKKYEGSDGIDAKKIPDMISAVNDDVLKKVIICEKSGQGFKITKQELAYYREHDIPLPHFHPEVRHQMRMQQRNLRRMWQRQCDCTKPDHGHAGRCPEEFETTFSPERKELVYCDKCYKSEIY